MKYDPKAAKDLYVVQGFSIRQIAKQLAVSPSAISERSIREDWKGQKLAYEASIARRSYENMAEQVASERAAIISENVLAARATIRRYLQDLASGKVSVTARDAELMMRFLVAESTPAEGLNHQSKDVTPGAPPDQDFLKRMIEVARSKVEATPTQTEGLKVH